MWKGDVSSFRLLQRECFVNMFKKLTKIEKESEDQIGFGEIEMLTGQENWRLIIPYISNHIRV